jgi:hypothetical protein
MMTALQSSDEPNSSCTKVYDSELSVARYAERLSEITGLRLKEPRNGLQLGAGAARSISARPEQQQRSIA